MPPFRSTSLLPLFRKGGWRELATGVACIAVLAHSASARPVPAKKGHRHGAATASVAVPAPKAVMPVATRAPSSALAPVAVTPHDEHIAVHAARTMAETQLAARNDVSVVDATFIARHPDTNIAETLARLPGVNVLSTTVGGSIGGTASMIDNASRGEGQFVSVRGIGPDYTLNLIDGVNVASAKPASRQIQLSLMPPLGFSQVVVSKTAQASDMGEWIAGTVDFHTPSAFEIGHDVFALKGRGDFSGQGYGYGLYRGPFNGGGIVQAEANKIFGRDGRFGVHAVGYYQSRNFASQVSNQNEGNWDFLQTQTGSDHSPLPGIAPTSNMIPEQINPQVSFGNSQRYGGNLALDWRGDRVSLFARGTYARSDTQQTTIQRGLQSTSQNAVLQPDGTYLTQEAGVVGSYYLDTNPEKQSLATMQLGASFDLSPIRGTIAGFGSFASDDQDAIQLAYKNFNLDPSGNTLLLNPVYHGDPAFPEVALTAAQLGQMNDLSGYTPQTNANWGFPGVEDTVYKNNQSLGGVRADLHAQTGLAFLPEILFGAKYYGSDRNATNRDYSYDNADGLLPGLPESLLGNRFQDGSLSSPLLGGLGRAYPYATPVLDAKGVLRYIQGLPGSYAAASYGGVWTGSDVQTAYNANVNTQAAQEHVTAAYVALPMHFGMLSLTPGFRYEHSEIGNRFWTSATDADGNLTGGQFARNTTRYNEFLPSVFATLRPDAHTVYRASFDTSYVRPNTFLLGGAQTITADGDNVFTIQRGNPGLRPVLARNFDLGGQWIAQDGSSFALSGFYKLMSHYLFDAGNSTRSDGTHYLSANGTEQISPTLIVITPHNGGSARAYGLEMSADKRFSFLPGLWKNVSLSGNATLQRTHADLNLPGIANGTPIQYAPSWMFNASIGYTDAKLATNLSLRRSGRFLETYYTYSAQNNRTVDISWWDQPIQRLDYFAGYKLTKRIDLSFAAQNLLNDTSYYATRGKHSNQIPQIVLPGRTFFLTLGVQL